MEAFKRTKFKKKGEWIGLRQKCIGGSDAAAIVGCNPWKTSVELYYQKKGLVEKPDISNEWAVKYGNTCEPAIRTIFKADYDGIFKVTNTKEHLTRLDKPYLGASLDGEILVLQDHDFRSYKNEHSKMHLKKGMRGVLEIKTTTALNSMHKETWSEEIPQNYYLQTLHYLNVTKYDFVILVVLIRYEIDGNIFGHYRQYGYMASDRLIDMEYLEQKEDIWWHDYYLKGVEPPLILPEI